jgi:hypothetical protein
MGGRVPQWGIDVNFGDDDHAHDQQIGRHGDGVLVAAKSLRTVPLKA